MRRKTGIRRILAALAAALIVVAAFGFVTVYAAEEGTEAAAEAADSSIGTKAIAAGIAVAAAAAAGALAMGITIAKSAESMARQPEAADKINSAMMLGLVFIETAIIYALIVAILIIFVL
ncbi:MAG: ATP synthase F0 subunit C [Clostridia bacterium]|nr:ATP synthase F0 subunit C [Clostridia bacterium]